MATSTSQTPFLTMTKSFTYRDARELWSNIYHLDSEPPSSSDWTALFNAVWALEGAFLPADTQIESGTGHTPGTPPVLVWEIDAPPTGAGGAQGQWIPGGAEYATPGDTAMWVRWTTDLKNKRGKPIYLRNYYHGAYSWSDKDEVASNQRPPLLALGLAWQNGVQANGRTYRRTGPNHGTPQAHDASVYLTTRTLKRRGKRKKPAVPGSSSSFFDAIEKSLAAKGLITIIEDALAAGA